MATDRGSVMDLLNETGINVAGLLKAATGTSRSYVLRLDRFWLDEAMVAEGIVGDVRLTRLRDGVMARIRGSGRVSLDCVRCLREYDQPFSVQFAEQYRQTVDVRSGVGLEPADDDTEETSRIDENHEIDLADVLRQEVLVVLPMRPHCGDLCPGPDAIDGATDASAGDDRFATLARLLGDEDGGTDR